MHGRIVELRQMSIIALCAIETARVQEDATGADLPDFFDDASQLRHLERLVADLLFRVRGAAVGTG